MADPADARSFASRSFASRSFASRSFASRGFTLIELMVAMVVSSIVVLGIFAFSSIQQTTTAIHERNVRVQQALEGAMFSMGQDVRAAGMGWTRTCTELRVWDAENNRLINPGGGAGAGGAAIDPVTGQAYWVLRDGIQGFWNSSIASSLQGGGGLQRSSARIDSAADALDVIVAESSYAGSLGVFTIPTAGFDANTDTVLNVQTGTLLDSTNGDHVAEIRQMFPPGSFVIVARGGVAGQPFRPETQSQCVLLQVTTDVVAGPTAQEFTIAVGPDSDFNSLPNLFADNTGLPSGDDWNPGATTAAAGGWSVVPLGRLRWSRYEIDYSVPQVPYLVRYDLIGFQDGVDDGDLGNFAYPHCDVSECPAPSLHLPGSGSPPRAVAIGPMIEDMQVAVGCDGYTPAGVLAVGAGIVDPELGYEELGPAEGPFAGAANNAIDENSPGSGARDSDEWLGNARDEEWAPDCVWYGVAEYDATGWGTVEGLSSPPPAYRMSPQSIRVTLVASGEFDEEVGGLGSENIIPVEDRPQMVSPVGVRQRFSLTERFTPENLRWRDPSIR